MVAPSNRGSFLPRLAALLLTMSAWAEEGATYTIRRGDSLSKIAEAATGDPHRYAELQALNPGVDANHLSVGAVLRLPEGWVMPATEAAAASAHPSPPETSDTRGVLFDGPPIRRVSSEPIDKLKILPRKAELEGLFRRLILRVALDEGLLTADDTRRAEVLDELQRLEQQVTLAEVQLAEKQEEHDQCAEDAAELEDILRTAGPPDTEMEELERMLYSDLGEALHQEQILWEDRLRRVLAIDDGHAWRSLLRAVSTGDWSRAVSWHRQLFAYRDAIDAYYGEELGDMRSRDDDAREAAGLGPNDYFEGEVSALMQQVSGKATSDVLQSLQQLHTVSRFKPEFIKRERVREELQRLQALGPCDEELTDVETFLGRLEARRAELQAHLTSGPHEDIRVNAEMVAGRLIGLLGEIYLLDVPLSNEEWSGLWWKAGVALRLADHDEQGERYIVQAAAVATEQDLPDRDLPAKVLAWLADGESKARTAVPGTLRVHVLPTARLTVDGREIGHTWGDVSVDLPPGVHRVLSWTPELGSVGGLVSVLSGEEVVFQWWEEDGIEGDDGDLVVVPTEPVVSQEPPPRRWFFSVAPSWTWSLGKSSVGATVQAQYAPKLVGVDLAVGVFAPLEDVPTLDGYLRVFGRFRLGLSWRFDVGAVRVTPSAGVWADTWLSVGPVAGLEVTGRLRKELRLGGFARGGWDLMPHAEGIPRPMVDAGLMFSF